MDPLGAVCSMTYPNQSNQISMTNFARSQQKNCGKFAENSKNFRARWGHGARLECMGGAGPRRVWQKTRLFMFFFGPLPLFEFIDSDQLLVSRKPQL